MREYQKFPISNFRSGFSEEVEPWLLPRDAFQQLINAHFYRGVLEKIDGYTLFANMTNRHQITLTGSGKVWTGNLTSNPTSSNFYGYGTITLGSSAEIFSYLSDASSTVINLVGNAGGHGTVQIVSPWAVSLTFQNNVPDGYALFEWDSAPAAVTAIMGIEQYFTSNGGQEVMVFDQRRVGIIVENFGVLALNAKANQAVSEIPHAYYETAIITGDGSTATLTGTLTNHPLVPGTVTFTQFTSSGQIVNALTNGLFISQGVTDNGQSKLQGPNVTSGNINYNTGAFSITFTVPIVLNNYFDVTSGLYGDLFTGSISDFFSLVNYQYKAFFCNNINKIFYYDGNTIQYLLTNLEVESIIASVGVPTNLDITSCLHVTCDRERLILLSPLVEGVRQFSAAFWSTVGNPLDWTNDEQLYAPTSEPIRTFGFVNTDLIVRFASSERVMRYTSDAFSPFRFDKTNSIWDCDAPYSSINYDSWYSSVGKPAIVGSDGVNVKRVDEIIPDFTDPTRLSQQLPVPAINQTSIQQCYGIRFDDIKEGWLCYNSVPEPNDEETQIMASNNVLGFNYLDSTYAIYSFPFSCLGFGQIINVPTWGTTYTEWQDDSDNWGSYILQKNALIDLGGDQYDKVYKLNDGNTQTIAGDATTTPVPVLMSAITKNFNPFIEEGELCRFGYLDLFVSAYSTTTLRVQFYLNDQLYVDSAGNPQGFYQENILTFKTTDAMSPVLNQTKVWKRIYIGAVGKEHTIRFYQNMADFTATNEQPIFIHSMVLWMKPAGRIFN